MTSAVLPIVLSGSNVDGAWEYNLRTTPWTQLPLPDLGEDEGHPLLEDGLPPQVARTTATVLGMWVDLPAPDCRPYVGLHAVSCAHRENLILATHSQLAKATYRFDGGPQIKLTRDALEQADSYRVPVFVWNQAERTYHRRTVKLLTLGEATDLEDGGDLATTSGRLAITLDGFLWRSMMAGHYQVIPKELMQNLRGAGFLVWTAALSHRESSTLRKAGDQAVYHLTNRGRKPADIRPGTLALSTMRSDKRIAAIERACEKGNAIQDLWRLEVEGSTLVLTRLLDRSGPVVSDAGADSDRSIGPDGPYYRTQDPVVSDAKPRSFGRGSRSNRATRQKDSKTERHELPLREDENTLAAALKAAGWTRPSSKMIEVVRDKSRRRRLGTDAEVADLIARDFPGRKHADLFEWLDVYRKPPRPIRTLDDIVEPPPFAEEAA